MQMTPSNVRLMILSMINVVILKSPVLVDRRHLWFQHVQFDNLKYCLNSYLSRETTKQQLVYPFSGHTNKLTLFQ